MRQKFWPGVSPHMSSIMFFIRRGMCASSWRQMGTANSRTLAGRSDMRGRVRRKRSRHRTGKPNIRLSTIMHRPDRRAPPGHNIQNAGSRPQRAPAPTPPRLDPHSAAQHSNGGKGVRRASDQTTRSNRRHDLRRDCHHYGPAWACPTNRSTLQITGSRRPELRLLRRPRPHDLLEGDVTDYSAERRQARRDRRASPRNEAHHFTSETNIIAGTSWLCRPLRARNLPCPRRRAAHASASATPEPPRRGRMPADTDAIHDGGRSCSHRHKPRPQLRRRHAWRHRQSRRRPAGSHACDNPDWFPVETPLTSPTTVMPLRRLPGDPLTRLTGSRRRQRDPRQWESSLKHVVKVSRMITAE